MQDEEMRFKISNEFSEVQVSRVRTRNGERLEITSSRLDRSVRLDALELESLTWQTPEFFSGLLQEPFGPDVPAE